jgi:phosphate transport system protein
MSRHLQRDIQEIHKRLMAQFGLVEQMSDKATRALCDRRTELVDEILKSDDQVNQAEVRIEEECLKILALHQPVASDLRRITTVLKINSDLERIADLACNVAERAKSVHLKENFPIPDGLPEMAQRSMSMVKLALDAFVQSDTALAKQVIQMDRRVDELNLAVIMELRGLMHQDSNLVDPALHCFSAARHIERIADHAENIAEDVIYLVDGEIVRHNHNDYFTRPPRPATNLAKE